MPMTAVKAVPLLFLLIFVAVGCASSRDVLDEQRYRMTAVIESDPPGYTAYVGKKYLGQTPVKFSQEYSHVTEELTFGGYRTGMALVISGGAGMAFAGGMIAGGAALLNEDNDGGSILISLGAVGLIYGFIGTIYGTIAMVGSSGPKEVVRTDPYKLTFGIKSPSGVYREIEVKPINDSKRKVHFDEIRKVKFFERGARWAVPGLKNLKLEMRQ